MYQLPVILDRTTASSLRDDLIDLVGTVGAVDIDASQVERATSVGLQLILSMKMQLDEEKRDVIIVNPSVAFVEAVKGMGLMKFLDVME